MRLTTAKQVLSLGALALGSSLVLGAPAAADERDCPWIVQPGRHLAETAAVPDASFAIRFDGVAFPLGTFYGFSVTDQEVAWRIAESARDELPDFEGGALRLQPIESDAGRLYQVDPRTAPPETLFLVAAAAPVEQLEELGARIEPQRAIAVSQLATRGPSDISGPLPTPVVPGFLIAQASAEADPQLQICAYEVALR